MAEDTKNFKVSEFACKCGCGYDGIDQKVINMAQVIRDALGVPVRVNSGCRCEAHNKKVGSCSKGAEEMFQTVQRLYGEGRLPDLDYCIKYRTFIHIDCGGKRNNRWERRA